MMRRILIVNSGYRPRGNPLRSTVTNIEYTFAEIWTMDDAYRFQGTEFYDIVWCKYPQHVGIVHCLKTRIRQSTESNE